MRDDSRVYRLYMAYVACRLWSVNVDLTIILALNKARLLENYPRFAARVRPQSRRETLAAHGCYPGQSNRTLRRSSWRARLRCSQENQGDQTSYLGGYVGAAPLGLCYQSRCT